MPEASNFILFVPPVAKKSTPPDSVIVQPLRTTVVPVDAGREIVFVPATAGALTVIVPEV